MCCSTAIWQLTVLSGWVPWKARGWVCRCKLAVSTSSTSHGTRDGEDIFPCPTEPTFTAGNREEEEEEEEEVTANAVQ
ncbi:unnamed protein product [Taenia asiatica]|uniref:Secreted protein n=1 Tax=Taenia asiatica TaxID=60517 RepID=A0A0R3WGR1_TAEAS|nr:unnamed protein product [Taenia asiatica]